MYRRAHHPQPLPCPSGGRARRGLCRLPLLTIGLLLTDACFRPDAPVGLACSPDGQCPPDQICNPRENTCLAAGAAYGIAAGLHHTCAWLNTGEFRCWGRGAEHQLADDTARSSGEERVRLADALGFEHAVIQIAAGGLHTCALLETGEVYCWGENGQGQLGAGHQTEEQRGLPGQAVSLGGAAVQIAAGAHHTCALLDDGQVRCWGRGDEGQLGQGDRNDIGDDERPSDAPPVSVGGTAIFIAARGNRSCAAIAVTRVACWGVSSVLPEPIGDDELPYPDGLVLVGGRVTQVAAGADHTCALLASGLVRCWGRGNEGQLGHGATTRLGDDEVVASLPVVPLPGSVVEIAAGELHTCAVLVQGELYCWGYNYSGQLGYGMTQAVGDNEAVVSQGPVILGERVAHVALGNFHTCALLAGGAVSCWGRGDDGQLGYGNRDDIGDDELPSLLEPLR